MSQTQRESLLKSNMQAETVSQFLTETPCPSKEPLPTIQTYCQSKTFIAKSGVNPLIAAASALFSLIAKLRYADDYPNIEQLRQDLTHEVKAFECTAQTRGYNAEQILISRYAICASLDEVIQNTDWGKIHQWHEHNLLTIFQGETWGGERIFMILDKLRQDPKQHIELLEFIYICLSLGFEGKFRVIENGNNEFEKIFDELFYIIKEQRGDLYRSHTTPFKRFKTLKQKKTRIIPTWIILGVSVILLTGVYLGYNYLFNVTSTPIEQSLENIISNNTNYYESIF